MNTVDPVAWQTQRLERIANQMAKRKARCPHAVELSALNGVGYPTYNALRFPDEPTCPMRQPEPGQLARDVIFRAMSPIAVS